MSFIISLLIFIIFASIGAVIADKIPKIDLQIPKPILSLISFGAMGAEFYYENDRFFQIILSFAIGLIFCYLLNCSKKED